MAVEELEAIQIQLDRAPGMAMEQCGEIIEQLLFAERLYLIIKMLTDAADRPGVALKGLGLKPFQLKVLQMGLVILLEC